MILSVENYTLRHLFGEFPALEMIKAAGFDSIDYSFYFTPEDAPILGDDLHQYAANVRRKLDELGLSCLQAHAPFALRYGEALDESEPHYRDIVRSLEAASILGVKQIVVHSLRVPEGVDPEEFNIGFYRTFTPYCEKFGIQIAVENLFERQESQTGLFKGRLASPASLCRVVKALDPRCFTACIDVAHAAITGTAPEDFIRGMEPGVLSCLHIHDTDLVDDIHTLPYLGRLNWSAILSALKDYGYDGELNFEIIGYLNALPKEAQSSALELAAKVGRKMICDWENA